MAYPSFYKEKLYFMDQKKPSGANDRLQATIVNLLSTNSAVGIIGGICEHDGDYSIKFISSFTLDLLKMNVEEFERMSNLRLLDLVWPHDRAYVSKIKMSPHSKHVFRVLTKERLPLWISGYFDTYYDETGVLTWVMSVCSIQIVINTIMRNARCMLAVILDLENQQLYLQKQQGLMHDNILNKEYYPYYDVLNKELEFSIFPEYKDNAEKTLTIANIEENLNNTNVFEYTIPQKTPNGKPVVIRRKYQYLDDSRRFIFVTCEDVTKLYSYDTTAHCLNLNGFLIHCYNLISSIRQDYTLIYFNIRAFKAYNETYGFESGDTLLSNIVTYIQKSFLKPIYVARGESDHFICLTATENVKIDKLKELCSFSELHKHTAITLHISCGIYYLEKDSYVADDLHLMCRYAKMAEQLAKGDISCPVCIYSPDLNNEYLQAAELISDFEAALNDEQFKIYYQPIYDVKTRQVASAEALVRWIHPKFGFISPGRFIPLFENHGIISNLDSYVSKGVLEFLERRLSNNKQIVPCSINFSRVDMRNKKQIEKILSRVTDSKVPDNYYRMEITESAYSSFDDEVIDFIKALHGAGVKILIDDFGSGYSTFACMANYTYNIVKLDMGFAKIINKDRNSNSIIRNIIRMFHDLDVQVIAEGIETEEQYQFLLENSCDYIQGFYFSKPLPEEDFVKLLDSLEDKGSTLGE